MVNCTTNASVVYKDKEFMIDFIFPITQDDFRREKSWHILLKDYEYKKTGDTQKVSLKNENCRIPLEEMVRLQKNMEFMDIGLFAVKEKDNIVCEEIYIDIEKSEPNSKSFYTESPQMFNIYVGADTIINTLIHPKYKYKIVDYRTYKGTIGKRMSYLVKLKKDDKFVVCAAAGRLDRKIRIYGHVKGYEELENVLNVITDILGSADFDATYPEDYLPLKLVKI